MLLFVVTETYQVPDKGLLLAGDSKFNPRKIQLPCDLKLIVPDGSTLYTTIIAIGWDTNAIIVSGLNQSEVPNGTEVWLQEPKT